MKTRRLKRREEKKMPTTVKDIMKAITLLKKYAIPPKNDCYTYCTSCNDWINERHFHNRNKNKSKLIKWHWPYLRTKVGGVKEYACEHGVGHGGVHGCCAEGCCSDPLFPGNSKSIAGYG